MIRGEAKQPSEQAVVSKLGADGLRYLIAEQKTFNDKTQHTAVLSFDGERHGLASWLGAPGPMGGLGFVSSERAVCGLCDYEEPAGDDRGALRSGRD